MNQESSRQGSLSEDEAKDRLKHADAKVLDELYEFGKMLLTETVARVGRLDTKATYIAAYSIGVVTLLVSTNSGWASRIHFVWLPILAGVAAFLSGISAVLALTLKDFKWFNDDDWLRTECLQNHESLVQYRVLSLREKIDSWEDVASRKADKIELAQLGLLVAALFLIASLIDSLVTL